MIAFERNKKLEFSKPQKIKKAQEELLQRHVQHLASHSPYYRALFKAEGIRAAKLTLDLLPSVPFTDKTALGQQNDDFLAVPLSRIVDIVLSSGTTGKPTTMMYTENDLKRLAYNEEISLESCGLTREDIVLLTCTMDRCFIAGLAYFSGVRSLGAAAIRNGLSGFESHLDIIQRLRPTAMVGVPTFLFKLGQFLKSRNIDPRGTGISRLICIGEPIRDRSLAFLGIGDDLEALWGAKIYSTYASSETITTFCECTAQRGGHLHPDLAIIEIVDENGSVLPPGDVGEVVVTPLSIEGMPLLRFKTGDMGFLIDEPCACGRFSPRLGPIVGRKKQMIKFRGTTLYPNSICAVLDSLPGISEYYITATSNSDLSDIVKVTVAHREPAPSGFAEMIIEKLQAHLRVRPEVVVESEEIVKGKVYAGNSRKIIRFMDERKKI
jgi:phenylacetate-CoA ligase